ncbi:MAG: alpha/beta hydrolase [Gemmatimonadaceae bacterium]|nr:alpha/beta hydrolase [Gemmatimonadaceae bacterium]
MRSIVHRMIPLAVVLGGLFALILLLAWRMQERMVFQPPAGAWPAPPGVERLELEAADGTPLFAYLVRGDTAGGNPVVIHFHGNAEVASLAIPWGQELAGRTGASVVLAEYRGYAGIPGSPTYAASRDDALALWSALQQALGATPDRTVIHGFSLGSAVAAELASQVAPRALVLEAPFTSARAMAVRMGPMLRGPVWRLIARVHYDTRARVASLDVPVWVAHGAEDGIIPVRMGREVYAAARRKGDLLIVAGAGHNDLPSVGAQAYERWIDAALGDASRGSGP